MKDAIYRRKPIEIRDGVPVFSKRTPYTENYEAIASDHLASRKDNPWIQEEAWREMEDSTAQLIEKYVLTGSKILDVGVGLGRLISRFPGLDRYGMDIAMGYLAQTKSKGIEVCFAAVEDMPFKPLLFDAIVCTDVLEHVIDLNRALGKILEVLKSEGILILRVPYKEDLSPYTQKGYPYQMAHLRTFDESSLKLLLSKVFECDFLEAQPVLFYPSVYKLKYQLPGLGRVIVGIASFSRILGKRFKQVVYRSLYHPTEINVVLRKQGAS